MSSTADLRESRGVVAGRGGGQREGGGTTGQLQAVSREERGAGSERVSVSRRLDKTRGQKKMNCVTGLSCLVTSFRGPRESSARLRTRGLVLVRPATAFLSRRRERKVNKFVLRRLWSVDSKSVYNQPFPVRECHSI